MADILDSFGRGCRRTRPTRLNIDKINVNELVTRELTLKCQRHLSANQDCPELIADYDLCEHPQDFQAFLLKYLPDKYYDGPQ
jgi:hypothetical protein